MRRDLRYQVLLLSILSVPSAGCRPGPKVLRQTHWEYNRNTEPNDDGWILAFAAGM